MKFIRVLSIIVFFIAGPSTIFAAYRCYTCQGVLQDMTCLTNPDKVPVGSPYIDCTGGWCTVYRREFNHLPGQAIDFRRSCHRPANKQPPEFLDDIVEDTDYTTFFRSCREDLCNIGDGLTSLGPGGGSGGGGHGLILVSGALSLTNSSILIIFLTSLFSASYSWWRR